VMAFGPHGVIQSERSQYSRLMEKGNNIIGNQDATTMQWRQDLPLSERN
jgi:hypothetical protein